MTSLQAEYTKILEARRHNLATEKQTDKSLEIEERKADESARHNQATEGLTLRDQQLRSAIASLDAYTKRAINSENIANEQQLKQWELNYKQKADKIKNTLDMYKFKINQQLEQNKLALNKKKTLADINKMEADIQNAADKLAFEYDKSWTATKTKWLRTAQGDLRDVPETLTESVTDLSPTAGAIVKALIKNVYWDPRPNKQGENIINHSILGKIKDLKDIIENASDEVTGRLDSSAGHNGYR